MTQRLFRNLLIVCFVLLFPLTSFPYDSYIVHPGINEVASRRSTNLTAVLQMLGYGKGVDSLVNGKEIFKWIRDGGTLEDKPVCRTKFHFHDPTKSFDSAGLSNIAIDAWCGNYNHRSSLVWAQDTADNFWSWQQARLYYLEALTGANKDIREEKFAATFRALGRVMHLVSDASVPAHVRNDIHIFPIEIPGLNIPIGRPTYESWAQANPNKLPYGGVQISQSIFKEAVNNNIAPVPVSALWDIDKYERNNPEETVGANIGIAEYTNANFFSEDTIFKNFTYPSRDSVTQVSYEIDDPRNPSGKVLREYYQKIAHGDTGYRLATVGFLMDYLFTFLPNLVITLSPFEKPALDGEVYGDYAARLVPRAVGYSAGLLDYFFRGKLEMPPSEDCSGYVIENNTEEEMNGTFELYYDNTSNERKQCWSGSFALGAWSSSDTITFTPPDDAKEPDKYILVFQGRLGNEDGAVVGAVANLAPSAFVLLTQTSLRLDVLGEGVNNATILVDGEILGIVSGGLGKINDETLEIENEGEGDLYINGQLITDKKWTYKNWFDATGWPNRWEVSHKPNTVVKLRVSFVHEGQEYYLMPTGVGTIRYTQPAIMPMEILLGNDVEVYHQCEKDYPCDELSFYYTFTGELEGVSFDVQYRLGEDFYSDNFPPDGVICCYGNHICRGTKVPEYGWDQCYPSIDGSCYPKDGDYELHILNNQAGSRWTKKYYEEYHGALNFGEWLIGPCYEEYDTLRPTECIVNDSSLVNCYVLGCDREYKAISPSEYRTYYKIRGSSLESLFLEKGYPLIERDVDITITGVDNRVL